MSDKNFLDMAMAGDALLEEIDDFIEAWHTGDSSSELHDVLGMTKDEYALWLQDHDMLAVICRARRNGQRLTEAVNDNLPAFKIAARAVGDAKLRGVEAWLRAQGKTD